MANPEHVAKLKEGVEAWNKWREENPTIEIDLSGVNLNGAYLNECNFFRANLSNAQLMEADLMRATLLQANLSQAKLFGAFLTSANLSSASLNGAGLVQSKMGWANLSRATLNRAELNEADLDGANLSESELFYSNLSGANLEYANLKGAKMLETVIANTNLSNTISLEDIIHSGPSIIDHRTFAKSGKLPAVFLQAVGLQDWQIEEAKLLQPYLSNSEINDIIYRVYDLRAHQAIQISPLFISYSHANTLFVNAIEKKLIDKGVRFWRDINDMNAGKMEKQVDRAIRLNDTVLLVLSKESVNSDWVEHEANKARKIEKERGKDVLCPIALDDAWKTCNWEGRLRDQIEKYNILDFSGWKNDEVFSRQFSKLLDGLDIFYK